MVAVVAAVEAVVAAVRLVRRIRGLLSLSGSNFFFSHGQRSRYLLGRRREGFSWRGVKWFYGISKNVRECQGPNG